MSASPADIVANMMQHDAFSQWLGIEVLATDDGSCRLRMQVRPEMVNGFGIAHGGITYSFADSALAFASNAGGQQAVSIETSIAHISRILPGDVLIAEAKRETESKKLGHYAITIYLENDMEKKPVALFRGMVFRLDKMHGGIVNG